MRDRPHSGEAEATISELEATYRAGQLERLANITEGGWDGTRDQLRAVADL